MPTRSGSAISSWFGLSVLLWAGCLGYRTPPDPGQSKTIPVQPKADASPDLGADAPADLRQDTKTDAAADAQLDRAPDTTPDARLDVRPDVRLDVRSDVPVDLRAEVRAEVRPDVPTDTRADARADVATDVRTDLPSDGRPLANCVSGQQFVLLLASDGQLYRFDSGTLGLSPLATVRCGNQSLNSMTVSPKGPAYISSQTGDLCSVDLTSFKSTVTPFSPLLLGMSPYGMALLPDNSSAGQSLYIAVNGDTNVNHLDRIDLSTYGLTAIGDISPAVPWAELTAGPQGELYGFAVGPTESLLLNINPKDASAIDVTHVPAGYTAAAFALVYWQDGFYLFLSGSSQPNASVYHYRKGDSQVTTIGTLNARIIGAGVAACP